MYLSLNEQEQFIFLMASPNMCFIHLDPAIIYLNKENVYTNDKPCCHYIVLYIKLVYISVNTI